MTVLDALPSITGWATISWSCSTSTGDTPIDAAPGPGVCDRHRGIGADGLIRGTRLASDPGAARSGEDALLTFELRNADGSAAEMSGNGMRCLAQAALDAGRGAGRRAVCRADPGRAPAGHRPPDRRARRRCGQRWRWASPRSRGEADRCNVGHGDLEVDIGNPHLVVLGPDPSVVDVERLGPDARDERARRVRTWSSSPSAPAPTRSPCGSGSAAWARPWRAAPAPRRRPRRMHHWGRVGRRVTVHQPGGDADVELREDGSVVLCGPSERVATCVVDPGLLA